MVPHTVERDRLLLSYTMIRVMSPSFLLTLLSFVFHTHARSVLSAADMKLANLTAIASCPPSCMASYPKLLIIGDSTVANYEDGPLQGWGKYIGEYVNLSVMNLARNGRSTRSYRNDGLWNALLSLASPGDFVLIEMGHNDEGDIRKPNNTRAFRNTLPGIGDETLPYKIPGARNRTETVHTFGWYLKQMIIDARERDAIPILSGLTPRSTWANSTGSPMLKADYAYRDYAQTVAEELKVDFIDHTKYSVRELQSMGQVDAKKLFPMDSTHTSPAGARRKCLYVEIVIRG